MIEESLKYFQRLTKNTTYYFEYVLRNLNKKALSILQEGKFFKFYIKKGNIEDSKFFFFKLEELLRTFKESFSARVTGETLNNISIWMRKAGQFKMSMEYLDKCQRVMEKSKIPYGILHINKSVVYSNMER